MAFEVPPVVRQALARPKVQLCLVIWGILTILSTLVIISPQIFYTETVVDLDENNPRHVILKSLDATHTIHRDIEYVMGSMEQTRTELERVNSRIPMFGNANPADLERKEELEGYYQLQRRDLDSMVNTREAMLVHKRALSPVFSQLAFEEARNLWWERQAGGRATGFRMFLWETLFSGFGGNRDGRDALIAGALRLVWNLSIGAIFALVDFAIRLPFWIKEYELFSSTDAEEENAGWDDPVDHAHYLGEGGGFSEENMHKVAMRYPKYSDLERLKASTPTTSSYISSIAFYIVAMSGAVGGTFLMLLVIWAPIILLGVYLVRKAMAQQRARRAQRGAEGARPSYGHYGGQGHHLD